MCEFALPEIGAPLQVSATRLPPSADGRLRLLVPAAILGTISSAGGQGLRSKDSRELMARAGLGRLLSSLLLPQITEFP